MDDPIDHTDVQHIRWGECAYCFDYKMVRPIADYTANNVGLSTVMVLACLQCMPRQPFRSRAPHQ